MKFKLESTYRPTGDQPEAIEKLVSGLNGTIDNMVLWGVTGSGKTFTMANVIEQMDRPILVLSHNKTLAAQLYSEFKSFFPNNAVEYFVSYYDYFQPEAYLPTTNTYIEKDLAINDEIERMRLSATASLISGRRDVIVVSSVSCIYGIGNPEDYKSSKIDLVLGQNITHKQLMFTLSEALFNRSVTNEFKRGEYRHKGEAIDIYVANGEVIFRIIIIGGRIEEMWTVDIDTGVRVDSRDKVSIHPASIFITTREKTDKAINDIESDLVERIEYFKSLGMSEEAFRIKSRTEQDIEMIKEIGYCKGIENYSRYFDCRSAGSRPFCLMDYFPDDFLLFIDESHVTVSQIRGMYGGDLSRKKNLVDYGWRLPSALDNRPLRFDEFESLVDKCVYVSATPAEYELIKCEGAVATQFIRPTGLLDPIVEVRNNENQIDLILEEIDKLSGSNESIIITTLTKVLSEQMYNFLDNKGVRCRYIHSDLDNAERLQHLSDFKKGLFDVLVGVNLLREGIDLPAVSLVMVLDADSEGFLRSETSLIQTAGRAARNVNGRVILFCREMSRSMERMIMQTEERRAKQMEYNLLHNITPVGAESASSGLLLKQSAATANKSKDDVILYRELLNSSVGMVAEDGSPLLSTAKADLEREIRDIKERMEVAAKALDFVAARNERDNMFDAMKRLADIKR